MGFMFCDLQFFSQITLRHGYKFVEFTLLVSLGECALTYNVGK